MKIGKIVQAAPSLNKLTQADVNVSLAYKIRTIALALQNDLDFFNTRHIALAQKYGIESLERPGTWNIQEENMPMFQTEVNELMQLDVSTEIKPVDVLLTTDVNLSVIDIGNLEGIINFIEEVV